VLLLQHLATIGRAHDLREFQAEVVADNHQMIKVLKGSGLPIQRSTEFGVARVLLTIADGTHSHRQRSDG